MKIFEIIPKPSSENDTTQEATFFGSPCKTPTCQGHTAGFIYQMKKKNKVLPGTPSPSFNNGAAIAQTQMDTKRVRNPKQGIKDTKGRFMKIPPVPTIK